MSVSSLRTSAKGAPSLAPPVVLPAASRHFAQRFSGGITPALTTAITNAGGGRAWFMDQLFPAKVADPGGLRVDGWFPSLARTPRELFERQLDETQGAWEVMYDLSRWTMTRRMFSSRQLNEVMVDFWSNLLHVPLMDDDAMFYRVSYDKMIRTYALTRFDLLLQHSTVHPAMGLFLDNAVSTKDAPNENLGRELLELHTVGIDAGYSELDVLRSAKMLTGYRVDLWWPSFRQFYDPTVHHTGFLRIMGHSSANASTDGRAATQAYLKYLAHHPATANRLARRLCVKFVSDQPSAGLVSAVASAYLNNDTAIRPTLLAMIDHPEFAASAGDKVRSPAEDYVATIRSLGIQMTKPVSDESFGNAMYWQYHDMGQAPYEWPAPNGFPEDNQSWTSAGRILTSFANHRDLAAGWWPTEQVTYRPTAAWLPALPATVDVVIDHIGRQILGQPPGPLVKQGVAKVIGRTLSHQLTADEAGQYWTVIAIISSLLDSPTHLHR